MSPDCTTVFPDALAKIFSEIFNFFASLTFLITLKGSLMFPLSGLLQLSFSLQ
jgi:hypothetical protein